MGLKKLNLDIKMDFTKFHVFKVFILSLKRVRNILLLDLFILDVISFKVKSLKVVSTFSNSNKRKKFHNHSFLNYDIGYKVHRSLNIDILGVIFSELEALKYNLQFFISFY